MPTSDIKKGPLYVDSTNNRVGIGTSSPSEALEVHGTTPILQINDRGLYQAQFGLIGNDLEIRGSSGNVEFYTGSADGASSTERMRIDASGRVGIGVSDPSQALDLVGTGNSGTGSVRAGGVGSGTQAAFIAQAQFGSASFGTYASYPAVLNSLNSPMVYFNTNASGRAVFAEGITFNGDTAAANALDDYEEGAWTPQLWKGATQVTSPTSANGKYIKIGDMLYINWYFYKNSGTNTASGNWIIKGIPFTLSPSNPYAAVPVGYFTLNNVNQFDVSPHRMQVNGTNYLEMYSAQASTNWTSGIVELGGSGVIRLT